MRSKNAAPPWITMAQASVLQLQKTRPEGWQAALSALIGGGLIQHKAKLESAKQVNNDFDLALFFLLDCATTLADYHCEPDTPWLGKPINVSPRI